jgi:hypothetical protein
MRHHAAMPPKVKKLKCARCGLEGPPSMVAITKTGSGEQKPLCTHATACNARVRVAQRREEKR